MSSKRTHEELQSTKPTKAPELQGAADMALVELSITICAGAASVRDDIHYIHNLLMKAHDKAAFKKAIYYTTLVQQQSYFDLWNKQIQEAFSSCKIRAVKYIETQDKKPSYNDLEDQIARLQQRNTFLERRHVIMQHADDSEEEDEDE